MTQQHTHLYSECVCFWFCCVVTHTETQTRSQPLIGCWLQRSWGWRFEGSQVETRWSVTFTQRHDSETQTYIQTSVPVSLWQVKNVKILNEVLQPLVSQLYCGQIMWIINMCFMSLLTFHWGMTTNCCNLSPGVFKGHLISSTNCVWSVIMLPVCCCATFKVELGARSHHLYSYR